MASDSVDPALDSKCRPILCSRRDCSGSDPRQRVLTAVTKSGTDAACDPGIGGPRSVQAQNSTRLTRIGAGYGVCTSTTYVGLCARNPRNELGIEHSKAPTSRTATVWPPFSLTRAAYLHLIEHDTLATAAVS
jgi:hypothetical protein